MPPVEPEQRIARLTEETASILQSTWIAMRVASKVEYYMIRQPSYRYMTPRAGSPDYMTVLLTCWQKYCV